MTKIIAIEGIGPKYAEKLQLSGISTTENLLQKAATREGRAEISKKSGIPEAVILEWVLQADLMTIDGIGPEFADFLMACGVETKPELALRSPQILHKKMVEVNTQKNIVRRIPTEKEIEKWIKQALKSPRRIRY